MTLRPFVSEGFKSIYYSVLHFFKLINSQSLVVRGDKVARVVVVINGAVIIVVFLVVYFSVVV